MPHITGNLGDIPDRPSFPLVPEGWHEAFVYECEELYGQDSGEPYLKWTFSVPLEGESRPGRVWDNTSKQESALWKLKSLLRALGVDVSGEVSLDTDHLLGQPIRIEIVHEEYKEKARARVNDYAPSDKEPAGDPTAGAKAGTKDDLPF